MIQTTARISPNGVSIIHQMPVHVARLAWDVDRLMQEYPFGQGFKLSYEYDSRWGQLTVTARVTILLRSFKLMVSMRISEEMIYPAEIDILSRNIVENLLIKMATVKED